jgi:hypothetical protein
MTDPPPVPVPEANDAGVAARGHGVQENGRGGTAELTGWADLARRHVVAAVLVLLASLVTLAVTIAQHSRWGLAAWALYAASLLGIAGALLLLRRRLPSHATIRQRLRSRRVALASAHRSLAEVRARAEAELREASENLLAREQQLHHRLVTFHEWMEFPQPYQPPASQAAGTQVAKMAAIDRRLFELLERQTQQFFERIQQNYYVREGRFQPWLLRDDAMRLVHEVALLYRPNAEQPLLETSLEQILRAASRICLQLLIVMERLPLRVKEFNLNSMYFYVRHAVKAYGMYKATEPYWPYFNTAYYLGRFAMGANPVTLGAWWFLGQHGTKLAQEWTSRLVERQILTLLRDVVRVIGFEAAAMYGGDFRHRDANWIYGVELVELMRRAPLAPKSFTCALQEIGALELRNEYDRVFLYRSLAAGQTADPGRYCATEALTQAQRQSIAHRLETFVSTFRLRGSDSSLAEWAREVEGRLDVKLRVGSPLAISATEQRRSALRSLAGYVLEVKQREPQELPDVLAATRVAGPVPYAELQAWIEGLVANPPFFFEPPELDPDGAITEAYMADLIDLAVKTPPHIAELDVVLANAAAFLRRDPDDVSRQVDDACRDLLLRRCQSTRVLPPRLPASVVRAVLDLLAEGEQVALLYGRVRIEKAGENETLRRGDLWLLGVADRLVLFLLERDAPRLMWIGRRPLQLERIEGWLSNECRIQGGEWHDERWSGATILVPGAGWKKFEHYFQPLLAFPALQPTAAT